MEHLTSAPRQIPFDKCRVLMPERRYRIARKCLPIGKRSECVYLNKWVNYVDMALNSNQKIAPLDCTVMGQLQLVTPRSSTGTSRAVMLERL